MSTLDRRQLLTSAVGAGALFAATPWLQPNAQGDDRPKKKIKIGQIGVGHEHAAGKMATFRKLTDHYEVVGVVEPDPKLRETKGKNPVYQGLKWMTEEELLGTEGLQAVAVEVDSDDDQLMTIAARCVEADKHIHLDKPGGKSYRQTRMDVGVEMCDNGLVVFEYPKATATIRTASLEVDGYDRRQLVACGDEGTVDIRPLETIYCRPPQPQKLGLTLAKDRDPYKSGYQEVRFPQKPGRYDYQLIELARIIRGEIENPFPLEHEILVQECLLEACGYSLN